MHVQRHAHLGQLALGRRVDVDRAALALEQGTLGKFGCESSRAPVCQGRFRERGPAAPSLTGKLAHARVSNRAADKSAKQSSVMVSLSLKSSCSSMCSIFSSSSMLSCRTCRRPWTAQNLRPRVVKLRPRHCLLAHRTRSLYLQAQGVLAFGELGQRVRERIAWAPTTHRKARRHTQGHFCWPCSQTICCGAYRWRSRACWRPAASTIATRTRSRTAGCSAGETPAAPARPL